MGGFALSERWNGWTDLEVMVQAAQAAVAAGPLDPLVCEITLEDDEDVTTIHNLDELLALVRAGEDPLSIEIYIADLVESDARLVMVYNGRWLQINGYGDDFACAQRAYKAAQVEIALVAGITTFKLPQLPYDTVSEVRRKRGVKDMDPGRAEADQERRGPQA